MIEGEAAFSRREDPYPLRGSVYEMRQGLTIVIPAFNERGAVASVLEDVKAKFSGILEEIILVDDGSNDGTGELASGAGARVIRHHRNMGYGASLKTGIREASTDFVLTMDADGQHTAEAALRLWVAMEENQGTDMVVGQREGGGNGPMWRAVGKQFITRLAKYLVKAQVIDLNSGLRLMRREVLSKYLHLCPNGFSFSTTITLAFLSRGRNVLFVPVVTGKRVGNSTVSVMTGFETILLVLRLATLFNPLRIFVPLSVASGTVGVLWSIPYLFAGRGLSVGSMLAVVTGLIFFSIGLVCDQISQLRMERLE